MNGEIPYTDPDGRESAGADDAVDSSPGQTTIPEEIEDLILGPEGDYQVDNRTRIQQVLNPRYRARQ